MDAAVTQDAVDWALKVITSGGGLAAAAALFKMWSRFNQRLDKIEDNQALVPEVLDAQAEIKEAQGEIKVRVAETNMHLSTLNGKVAQNVREIAALQADVKTTTVEVAYLKGLEEGRRQARG